ncbi:hypothetical protein EYF80_040733 [Liparis tanakae]|uniref:Uncharacterized protein n=1 Tax=Liparis tanakae TaxID=230148 RepID=A0A4Z2G682_9TELE|nr:hypothetical protein EYF80_040733 [Liparis tanakae]
MGLFKNRSGVKHSQGGQGIKSRDIARAGVAPASPLFRSEGERFGTGEPGSTAAPVSKPRTTPGAFLQKREVPLRRHDEGDSLSSPGVRSSSSVVELPLLVDGGRGGYEQGLRRDVGFEGGGPANDGAPVLDLVLLLVVAVLARHELPVEFIRARSGGGWWGPPFRWLKLCCRGTIPPPPPPPPPTPLGILVAAAISECLWEECLLSRVDWWCAGMSGGTSIRRVRLSRGKVDEL